MKRKTQSQNRAVKRPGRTRLRGPADSKLRKRQPGKATGRAAAVREITERKRAEEALRQSEAQYRALVEQAADGIFITDEAGRYLDVNPSGCSMLGYTREEIIGKDYTLILSAEDVAQDPPKLQRLSDGETLRRERLYRHKDGTIFPIEIAAKMLSDGRVQSIVRDITERRRAEETIRTSEEKYSKLFEEMIDGFALHELICDEEGVAVDYVTLEVNRAYELLLGAPRASVVGKKASEILPHSELKHWLEIFAPVALTGGSAHYETYSPFNQKYLEGKAYCPEKGKFAVTFADVTARKKGNARIEESEAKQRAIFNNAGYAMGLAKAGTQVLVNQAYLELFGYNDVSEVTGKSLLDDIAPEERPRLQTYALLRARGEPTPLIYETQGVRRDGTLFDMEVRVSTYEFEGETFTVGIMRDVTERKRVEKALTESEKHFRDLFENATMAIFQSTVDGKVIAVNSEFARMFGYESPEEVAGMVRDVSTDIFADPQRRREIIRLRVEHPDLNGFENLYRRKDGSTFLGKLHLRSVMDSESRLLYFEGIIEDITERKRAEEALRESEERLAGVIETVPDGIVTLNREGQVTFANPAAEKILGLTRIEVEGRIYNDSGWKITAIDGGPFPGEQLPFARVMQTRQPVYNVEHAIEYPDGTRVQLSINAAPLHDPQGNSIGMIAALTDITERKRAEEALNKSEKKYRTLFTEMLEGFALHEILCDSQGNPTDYRFLDINPAFERITGLKAQDIVGRTVLEVLPATERSWIETYGRVALTGEPALFENYSSDMKKHFQVTAFQPAPNQFACIFTDITERKGAEEALRESEEKYRNLFDNAQVGMYRSRIDGSETLEVNQKYLDIVGMTREELLGKSSMIVWADPQEREEMIKRLAVNDSLPAYEYRLLNKRQGEERNCLASIHLYRDQGILEGSILDITDRKSAEALLRESESKLKAIIEILPVGVSAIDAERKISLANPALERILEISSEDLFMGALQNQEYLRADGTRMPIEELPSMRALKEQKAVHNVETGIVKEDGRVIWTSVSAAPIEFSNLQVVVVTADITERKRVEQALHDSQERFHRYFELGLIGMAITSPTKGLIEVNEQMCKILGYERSELVQNSWDKMTHPDDLAQDAVNFDRVMKGEIDGYSLDKRWIRKEGRVIDSTISVKCLRRQDGSVDYFVALVEDITERKRTEEALRTSKNRYDDLVSKIPIGIYTLRSSPAGTFVFDYVSPKMAKMFDTSAKSILADPQVAYQMIHPDDLDAFVRLNQERIRQGEPFEWEGRAVVNGSVKWLQIASSPDPQENGDILWNGVVADITDRKRAEGALFESQALTNAIVESTSDMIWSVDPERFGLQTFNHGLSDYFLQQRGMRIQTGMRPEELFPPGEFVKWWHEFYRRTLSEGTCTAEYNVFAGSILLQLTSNLLKRQGKVFGISIFGKDITERKRQESALRESQARFSTIFQSSPVATSLRTLADGRCLDVNEAYLRLSEYSREELINHTMLEIGVWKDSTEYRQFVDRLAKKQYVKNVETAFQTKSGQTRHVLASYEKIQLEEEECILALFQDITERKQAEVELQQAHEELRALTLYWQNAIEAQRTHIAREIHDEFGQSMSALKMDLTWLTNRLPEEDERVARIRTMTDLVDSSIAQMRRIATELRPGLLDDLGLNAALEWQAREFYRRTEIPCTLKLPDDDLALDPTLNTTLFRIFQEALTNVLRHAQATRVDASFQQEGETLVLTIQDNGRGITEHELKNPHSLGLLGMRERAAQWGGSLTLSGRAGEGTTVTVRLPLPAPTVKGGKR